VAGLQAEHVHHKNELKQDNSPANLQPMSPSAHAQLHGLQRRRFSREQAAELYRLGWGLSIVADYFGVAMPTMHQALKQHGVQMRTSSEAKRWRPIPITRPAA
jgi:hypothetical protein